MTDPQLADRIAGLEPARNPFDGHSHRAAYLLGFSDARGLAAGVARAAAGSLVPAAVHYELEWRHPSDGQWGGAVTADGTPTGTMAYEDLATAERQRAWCVACDYFGNGGGVRVVEVTRRAVPGGDRSVT